MAPQEDVIERGIVVDDSEEGILVARLDRPSSQNSLTPDVLRTLRETLARVAKRGTMCVTVISTTGDHFSSGYDTRQLADGDGGRDELPLALAAIEAHPFPVVAAVRGNCIGAGLDLALACDVRIAAADASFAIPPAKLGIVYPATGVRRLMEAVGTAWSRLLLFTGDPIDAETAARIRLVQHVVPGDRLEDEVLALARRIGVERAPLSVLGAKQTVRELRDGADPSNSPALDALVAEALASQDHREALQARAERRPPTFRGA